MVKIVYWFLAPPSTNLLGHDSNLPLRKSRVSLHELRTGVIRRSVVPLQRAESVLVEDVGQVAGPVGKTMAGGQPRPVSFLEYARGCRVLVLLTPKPFLDTLGRTLHGTLAFDAAIIVTIAVAVAAAVVAAVIFNETHQLQSGQNHEGMIRIPIDLGAIPCIHDVLDRQPMKIFILAQCLDDVP